MATVHIVPSNDGKQRSAFPAGDYVQLSAPTGLSVSVNGVVVIVSWASHNGGTAETRVEFSFNNGAWQTLETKAAGTNTHTASLPQGSYLFRVMAVSGVNQSTYSNSVAASVSINSGITLIESQQFESPILPELWNFSNSSAGVVSVNTNVADNFANSFGSVKGLYRAGGNGESIKSSYYVSNLNTRQIFVEFKAKMPSPTKHGCKFLKIFGGISNGDQSNVANVTFGLDYTNSINGGIIAVSYGDGTTVSNDTQNIIKLNGTSTSQQIGRSSNVAQISTPKANSWLPANWGTSWHHFKMAVKFNSGDSAETEVADGEFYLEIDGVVWVDAKNIFNRHYSNAPISKVELFGWSQNRASDFELWYDDVRITTGGFQTSRPALIANDNFETYQAGATVNGSKYGQLSWASSSSSVVSVSSSQFVSGSKSLSFSYSPNSTAEQSFSLEQPHKELTIKYKWRIPTNHAHTANNNKFAALWMDGYSSGGDGPSIIWEFWPNGSGGSALAVHYSEGANTGAGVHLQQTNFITTPDDRGAWYDVILYVKAATARTTPINTGSTPYKVSNGVICTYIKKPNGQWQQLHNVTSANIAPPVAGPDGFKNGYFMGWANGPYSEQTIFYVDDVEFYSGDARNILGV